MPERLYNDSSSESKTKDISFVFCAVFAVLSLGLGVFAYILFRQDTLISVILLEYLHLDKLITPGFTDELKQYLSQKSSWLLYFSKNYLSDYCWAYSLEICIIYALRHEEKRVKNSIVISFAFMAFAEFIQVIPFVPGTFDVFDIACETIAILVATLTVYIHIINKN